MKFKKNDIILAIKNTGMIPVFYHSDLNIAKQVADACYQEGVKIFEFTNRGANADKVFEGLLNHVRQYPDFMLGIGTIMDDITTKKFLDIGADFIVSPVIKPGMAVICHDRDALWIPGCATVTELVLAKDCGAEIMKVFPASVLGPAFVSSVMPVVPGLQLMPTGGIEPTEDDLSSWFKAGVVCVGMGSQLISKQIIFEKDWTKLRKNIAQVLAIIGGIRLRDKAEKIVNL
jgi:2-dehydro-3-deoxyphosphogluconate aldolase/(4S)-4-hydroxy-2-oxoglutarate aldolase